MEDLSSLPLFFEDGYRHLGEKLMVPCSVQVHVGKAAAAVFDHVEHTESAVEGSGQVGKLAAADSDRHLAADTVPAIDLEEDTLVEAVGSGEELDKLHTLAEPGVAATAMDLAASQPDWYAAATAGSGNSADAAVAAGERMRPCLLNREYQRRPETDGRRGVQDLRH